MDLELRSGIGMLGGIGMVSLQARESGKAGGSLSISHWMCRHGAVDAELR